MTNTRQYWTPYLGPFSSVETFHQGGAASSGFGQFGSLFDSGQAGATVRVTQAGVGSKEYQLCQIDSGATSSTPSGAIAIGQTMYWKNRALYQVTTDPRFTENYLHSLAGTAAGGAGGVAGVAGILVAPTTGSSPVIPGDWVYLQTRGQCAVALTQGAPVPGDWAIPNVSATVPQLNVVAAGTAPTSTVVGRFMTPAIGGVAIVDLQLPEIP